MNKKILPILLVVMSLSFFSLSCVYVSTRASNSVTEEDTSGGTDGGSNPGDGGTVSGPTVVNADSIANAVKSALGNEIEVGTSMKMSTDSAHVTLSDSTITFQIDHFMTPSDPNTSIANASRAHLIKYLNEQCSANIKQAFILQGIDIQGNLVFEVKNYLQGPVLFINLKADSIKSNPDTEAYTLPAELKDKQSITIEFKINADTGDWPA